MIITIDILLLSLLNCRLYCVSFSPLATRCNSW